LESRRAAPRRPAPNPRRRFEGLKAKTIAAQPLDPPPNKNLASSIKGRVIDDAARPEHEIAAAQNL
jgi:hypothetical protein